MKLKSAVIGCGSIAHVHSEILHNADFADLVAFADIQKDRAESFVSRYGGHAYSSLEELLEHESIDVVHICTPHWLHTPMALYARSHGAHVFMEKPPAISAGQFAELCAQTSEQRLGICFQNRYNPEVQAIKELLKDSAGKVLGARAFVTWHRDEKYYTESGWRGILATEGGGVLINQAIHTLDLLVYLLGSPVSVEAMSAIHHIKHFLEVEDTVEAYIDFGEVVANFYATNSYCADAPVLLEIVCENMTLRMEDKQVFLRYKDGRQEIRRFDGGQQALGKDYWGSSHKLCIADFYRCVTQNSPFDLEVKDIAETMGLMYGIYDSAKSHTVIDLTKGV